MDAIRLLIRVVLFVLMSFALLFGVLCFSHAKTVMHEIEGLLALVIASVLIVAQLMFVHPAD